MYDGDGIDGFENYDADLKFEYIYVVKELLAVSTGTLAAFLFFFLFHALGRSHAQPLTYDLAFLALSIAFIIGVLVSYSKAVTGLSLRASVRQVHLRQTWSVCPNFASRCLLLACITFVADYFFRTAYKPELVGQDSFASAVLAVVLGLGACAAHVALHVLLLSSATARPEASAARHAAFHTLAWLGPTMSAGAGWMAGDVARPLLITAILRLPHLLQPFAAAVVIGCVVVIHIILVLPLLVKCATLASSSLLPEHASVAHEVLSVIAQLFASSVGWLAFHCTLAITAAPTMSGGGRVVWGLLAVAAVVLLLPNALVQVRQICANRRMRAEGSVDKVYFNALLEIYTEPCVRSIVSLTCAAAVLGMMAAARSLEGKPDAYVGTLLWVVVPISLVGFVVCAVGRWKGGGVLRGRDDESAVLLEGPQRGYATAHV